MRWMRGFHYRKGAFLSVHAVGMKLNPYGLPDDTVHASGFSDKDIGNLKVDVMAIFSATANLSN
jgi:hypothetical protein